MAGPLQVTPVVACWLQVELKVFAMKTAVVLVANLGIGHYPAQCAVILILTGWMAYVHVRWVRPWLLARGRADSPP